MNRPEGKFPLSFQLMGDISLNGLLCDPACHNSLASGLSRAIEIVGNCDLRIGNLESPLWGDGKVNTLKSPRLCTTRQAAECILPLGLDVVLLANNHIYDCCEAGFSNTVSFLEKQGIFWLGAGRTQEEAARPLIISRRDSRIGILNYVSKDTCPCLPPDAAISLNIFEEEKVLCDVGQLSRDVDALLLFLHWGERELTAYPTVEQRRFCRRVAENGAHVVACSHAHCLQGFERWDRSAIFYGLGNVIFSCFGGRLGRIWPKMSRQTGIASCTLSDGKIQDLRLSFFVQEGLCFVQDDTAARHRKQNRLNRRIQVPDKRLKWYSLIEKVLQRGVTWPLRFITEHGGFPFALSKIRRKHFMELWSVFRRTS